MTFRHEKYAETSRTFFAETSGSLEEMGHIRDPKTLLLATQMCF